MWYPGSGVIVLIPDLCIILTVFTIMLGIRIFRKNKMYIFMNLCIFFSFSRGTVVHMLLIITTETATFGFCGKEKNNLAIFFRNKERPKLLCCLGSDRSS